MTELLTYSLEFRGDASRNGNAVVVRACAPSCTHETRLGSDGIAARFLFDNGAEEAILDARLLFNGDGAFSANASIDFGHGHRLYAYTVDDGSIAGSADEHLRHGSAVLHVVGGTGQFEGATGRVTCNFVLSDTGDFTDNQLGMLFLIE
jgi:hypothetical protein